MRALFVRLAEGEGRFTVSLAHGEPRAGRDGVAVAWTVVVRDNAHPPLPLPGSDVHALYRLTDAADLARLGVGDQPDGLCGLEEDENSEDERRSACAYTLTWHDILRALDQIDARAPGWTVERIVGTPARAPRYGLTIRTAAGESRLVPSQDAVDHLCLEEGPLGAARLGGGGGAPAAGRRALGTDGPSPNSLAAWALRPARRPLPCTRGGLTLAAEGSAPCLWVDLCAPTADDLRTVARALCLPYGAVLATLAPDGLYGAVRYRDCTVLRVPVARRAPPGADVVVEPLDLIIGRDALVTIHARPLPALKRVRAGAALAHIAAAPALTDLVLAEMLASEEALARWVTREATGWAARAPSVPDPRACLPGALHCKNHAAALRRAAERRRGALAGAATPGGDVPASPLPAMDDLLAREARLVAGLRATERTADGAVRLLAARAAWRERARRAALIRLACVLAAAAIVGLARLALSGTHLAAPALGATTLVCVLIAGAGGAIAVRAADARSGGAERRARATWEDDDEGGEIE